MTNHQPGEGLAIETNGLEKRFGSVVALDGVDLAVPTGTVLGLLGPNGAGKTTAVRILTTILRPDAGVARVRGIDVARHPNDVRGVIGLAGQYAAVDENLTGRENLRMVGRLTHLPTKVIRPRADELLEQFGLTDARDRPVKTYSGGMRRRLDLAASLVHRPPVLFLDEPTTGLDPASRVGLWEVIENLVASGSTLLLTTQYLEEADRLADRVSVIDHGRVIAEGTPTELKANMGATVLEIDLGDEATATRAAELLRATGVKPPTLDGGTVELTVDDGARLVIEVLRTLDDNDFTPKRLALREPSLDDVFLALTGHKAEHEQPASDEAGSQPDDTPTKQPALAGAGSGEPGRAGEDHR